MAPDAPDGAVERATALDAAIRACDACPAPREEMRRNACAPSIGSGYLRAPVLLVGAAPQLDDLVGGRPFGGEAGRRLVQVLWHAMAKAGLAGEGTPLAEVHKLRPSRANNTAEVEEYLHALRTSLERVFFFTNATRCLPLAGKAPASAVVKACRRWTLETIYAVDPVLIIAVGKAAGAALLDRTTPDMGEATTPGKLYRVGVPGRSPVVPAIQYAMCITEGMGALLAAEDQGSINKAGKHYTWSVQVAHALRLVNRVSLASAGTDIWGRSP